MDESSPSSTKRNINSYYGHKVGFWQSLSLILNAGLMVYAHIGLSGVIFTNQDPAATSGGGEAPVVNGTGVCTEADIAIWTESGGEANRPIYSTFCSREYVDTDNNGAFCLSNPTCIASCFQAEYGYTADCSACLSAIPLCAVQVGCSLVCAADSLGQECQECNGPCIADMFVCSGLPQELDETSGGRRRLNSTTTATTTEGICNDWDLDNVPIWYRVYDLTFVGSVNDAWTGDAQLLAVIVVFFSGFWPYAKNVILLVVWYLPMTLEWQTWTILWLSRLSKYTLVDVFAVVVVLVGVQLQLNVGGTEAIIRAEPRFGILAFFVATLWEFIQIEVIKAMHEDKILNVHGNATSKTDSKSNVAQEETAANQEATTTTTTDSSTAPKLYFESLTIPAALWILSVILFVAGGATEMVQFTSKDLTATEGCALSYNLVTLANALVNELGLIDNGVAWQTWILYIVYVLLNLAFPILVHMMQAWSLLNWKSYQSMDDNDDSKSNLLGKLQKVSLWTSAIWCFACIEVLLIGVFAVEFKFDQLVAQLAGDSNAVFLDISSGLGPGFYILIVYSVIAGFLQFTLRVVHPMPSSGGGDEKVVAVENTQEETNDV